MLKKILLSILLLSSYIHGKVLIWDFGGLLFEPDKLGVAREIGIKHFVSYLLFDWQNPNIEEFLFHILSGIKSDYIMPDQGNFKPAGSAHGIPLPPIMCEWQAGTKTGFEIIKLAEKHIEALNKQRYFESEREKNLLKRTIRTMFNPEVLARNVYPVEEGVKLLKECAYAKNPDGTKKHTLIAFSNWDRLSFNSFYERNKRVFRYFDHIVVSGNIGLIKPYKEAFEYLINSLKLNPNECILLDDQKVNAQGAQACGMKAILIHGHDFDTLRIKLAQYGAI